MGNTVGGLLGGLTGGLLGGVEKPKTSAPKEAQKTNVDPDTGSKFAEARKRKAAAAAASGRNSLRIDLTSNEPLQNRSGLTIA